MKTLMIITGGLGTGGLERISCFVANSFVKKGWRVVILTLLQKTTGTESFQYLDESVIVKQFEGKRDPLNHKISAIKIWKKMIKKYTKEYNPNSILAMTFKIASMVCLFAPKMASRVTIREISDPKSKVRNQLVNRLTEFWCRKVKNIIFQTNWEKNCYHKKIRNKGVVVPNPLSITVNEYGAFNEEKFFTLSRLLMNQKRQDILVKGFALFHQKYPDYVLEIFGKGDDEGKIEQLILENKCEDCIKILPPVPNIHDKIKNYRGFVLTSDFEGMSNALLECYSLGIPCVSSDWPGVEDVVTDKVDGLIYPRQDVEKLAECLSIIASNDQVCKDITTNAINNSKRFDSSKIIARYCEVIESE